MLRIDPLKTRYQNKDQSSIYVQRSFYLAIFFLLLSLLVLDYNVEASKTISCFFSKWPALPLLLLTELGNGLVAIILIIGLGKNIPHRLFVLFLLSLTVQLLKYNFDIPRPASIFEHNCITGQIYTQRSFPSGHAATSFLIALIFLEEGKKARYLVLLFFISGYSRVFVGAHFLLDVTASGFLASCFYLTLNQFKYEKNGHYPWLIGLLCFLLVLHPGPTLESNAFRILGCGLLLLLSFSMKPPGPVSFSSPFFILITALAINPQVKDWTYYLIHLGKHQASSIFMTSSTKEALCNEQLNDAQKENLRNLKKLRPVLETQLNLQSSKSFQRVKYLDRDHLGYQLTFAKEFDMKLKKFRFPLIGKFSYLGFFDRALASTWKKQYQRQGYDVHISYIAAYSTLGYFPDPIFSTYLNLSQAQFSALVAHELVHEAFYIRDDTFFSERLAAFLENKLGPGRQDSAELESKPNKKALNDWNKWLDQLISDLKIIYTSSNSDHLLRSRKRFFLDQKKAELMTLSKTEFKELKIARNLALSSSLWNNAALLQMKLYRSESKGLQILWEDSKQDPKKFMNIIRVTENCTPTERRSMVNEADGRELYKLSCLKKD